MTYNTDDTMDFYKIRTNTPVSKPIRTYNVENGEANIVALEFCKTHNIDCHFFFKSGSYRIRATEDDMLALTLQLPDHSEIVKYKG